MVIKVGTLVLCQLLIKTPGVVGNEQTKIKELPGIVKEISYTDQIEMFKEKYAIKTKKMMLIVEPEEQDQIFKIGADACRPVIDEQTHLQLVREEMRRNEEAVREKDGKSKDSKTVPTPTPAQTPNQNPLVAPAMTPELKIEQKVEQKVEPKKAEKPMDPDKAKLLKQLDQ